jgi:hypothetical protein
LAFTFGTGAEFDTEERIEDLGDEYQLITIESPLNPYQPPNPQVLPLTIVIHH